ncbi:MAG: ECF transporter S component [Erysipelotrichia bacterium]|nr:ECF transporter S component [Erysipelotrichia bacterium]
MNYLKTKKLVAMGLFIALVVILQYLSSFVKFGTFSISLVCAPIVVAAALYGPLCGAILGFIFGVVVLFTGDASIFMAYKPVVTIIVVLLKGTIAGAGSGIIYQTLSKKNQHLAGIISSIAFPVINTGIFLISCIIFYQPIINQIAVTNGYTGSTLGYLLFGFVGLNFVWELLINCLLANTIVRLIHLGKHD